MTKCFLQSDFSSAPEFPNTMPVLQKRSYITHIFFHIFTKKVSFKSRQLSLDRFIFACFCTRVCIYLCKCGGPVLIVELHIETWHDMISDLRRRSLIKIWTEEKACVFISFRECVFEPGISLSLRMKRSFCWCGCDKES